MFAYQGLRGAAEVAFTDRHGGSSGGPFASLNLALGGDDDPAVVERNLAAVATAFTGGRPASLVSMGQVHGSDVAVLEPADLESPTGSRVVPAVDALVTAVPGVVLVVRVADCVPVVLVDDRAGVVAVAHAGRPGLAAGVVPRTLEAMRALGADQIHAWVGPHVCGSCYEVPAALRAEVAARVPASFAETSWGTPALDIGAGVHAQLAQAGVTATDVSRCTLEDDDLYSYRRQGAEAGRLAGLVWWAP